MDNIDVFEPGSRIDTLGIQHNCKITKQNVYLRFPSRIHMTPIDCNRFGFGVPGGGGMGFAIDVDNFLRISVGSEQKITASRSKDVPIASHYAHVMREVLGCQMVFSFDINVSNAVKQHFGLGSSVSVACAVVFGLNKMHGTPLSIEEMRCLIAYNFVEEFGGMVSRGLETGVGTSVILRGGISVVGGELIEVFHSSFPQGYKILLIDPHTNRPDSDKPESQEMLNRTFFLDTSYRYTKAYNILMDIIPAIHKRDFQTLGNYTWDIQYSGTHLSMIQSYEGYGRKLYDTLAHLRSAGVELCGLSSVGPAIYAVIRNEEEPEVTQTMMSRVPDIEITCFKLNNWGISEVDTTQVRI